MSAHGYIQYDVAESIGFITFNRPEVSNAYNNELLLELEDAWLQAESDAAVKVVVLRANGDHFCAGGDLKWYARQSNESGAGKRTLPIEAQWHWRNLEKPSIASVQGAVVAGGLRLLWPCDLIIAADDAKFADTTPRFGIGGIFYHGHTWELGARKAKEMLFTTGFVSAEEARRLGMVNKVVARDRLESETKALASQIAEMDAFGLAQAKRSINQSLNILGQRYIIHRFFELEAAGLFNITRASTVFAERQSERNKKG